MRGIFWNANDINLFFMIFYHMSLHCKLDQFSKREYENALLNLSTSTSHTNAMKRNYFLQVALVWI